MNTYQPELESRFICAIRESYANYRESGARSTKKLRPLHQWVADEMQRILGSEYVVQSIRKDGDSKEQGIHGQYYDKKVDISISKKDAPPGTPPVAIISIKFITSNFKQNANNYFEHLMGETANIRRRDIIFGHFMVLPNTIPYLNKEGEIDHEETITSKNLEKYVQLGKDDDYPHKPDAMGVVIISLPINNLQDIDGIDFMDINNMEVTKEIKGALAGELSLSSFIQKMCDLVRGKA